MLSKKFLSFVMALVMVLSLLPFGAMAAEGETEPQTQEPERTAASEETTTPETIPVTTAIPETTVATAATVDPLAEVRQEITAFLEFHGLSDTMTDDELLQAYYAAEEDPMLWGDRIVLQLQSLSDQDLDTLFQEPEAVLFDRFYTLIRTVNTPTLLAEKTVTMFDGGLSFTDSEGTGSVSGTTYTATATGGLRTTTTNTITITNNSGAAKQLSFTYNLSGNYSDAGTFPSASSNSVSVTLADKATYVCSFTCQKYIYRSATLTLSNITFKDVASNAAVTITYDSSIGSVSVDGEKVASGDELSDISTSAETQLVASPASSFVGWVNTDTHALLSDSATYSMTFGDDTNITAVFSGNNTLAWFKAAGSYWTDDLQEAADYASDKSDTSVVLMSTGVLPDNESYTIPSGVKLLIPNSASDTGAFTSEPSIQLSGTIDNYAPSAFRTLIVPSGTTITCNGSINVNGHRSDNGQPFCGTVLGGYGKIILGSESKTFSEPEEDDLASQLIIGEGGKLYCYGYITGSGMVEIRNSGTLHELLQIGDWPGGSNGTSWSEGSSKQFLLSQYYVQNIEAPLKLNHGATENFEAVITASSMELKVSSAFVGTSSGLFQMTGSDTYILRIYNQAADRMNYHLYGGSYTFGSVALYKNLYIAKIDIDSANSIIPITNNLSVHIENGTTLNVGNRTSILPGAEVVIDDGGTVNLSSKFFIYDVADWSGVNNSAMSMFFNRVAQAINDGWLPDGANINPQTNPLPYVATLDGVSPRATQFYAATKGSSYCQTDPLPITASGKLKVNGTLNVKSGGALYTTTGGSSSNKAISGTGTINYTEGTIPSAGTVTVGTGDYETTVAVGPAAAYLAGFDGLQNFGNHIYHSQADGYWYNYKITAVDNNGSPAASAVTVITESAKGSDDTKKLIGYVSYNTSGQSAFNFTTDIRTVRIGETTLTPTNGAYSLPTITSDTELTLYRIIAGTSVRAGDCLDIYFYVTGLEGNGYTAKITRNGEVEKEIPSSEWLDADSYRRFAYTGIAAKEMTDMISVTIYEGDNVVSETATESIESYALRTLEKNTNTYLQTTLVDMLNYGADAQTYFGHNADNLANADLTDAQKKYGTQTDAVISETMKSIQDTSEVTFAGASVTAETTLYLSFYFEGITAQSVSNFKAVITYTDHYGTSKTRNIAGSSFVSKSGYYGPRLTGLAIADGRQIVNCKIYNGNTLVAEAEASVEGYAAQTIKTNSDDVNLVNVCKTLMKFVDSAKAYFNSSGN